MRFEGLDLNLLNTLHVLLKHRSVTVAAEEIHLSQSAVSGALSRLREYFKDELLVPCGRTMAPTPRAEALQKPLEEALFLIRTRITTPTVFDPMTSTRQFSVIGSDYVYAVLVADVMKSAMNKAPNIKFDLMPPTTEAVDLFDRGEVDFYITIDPYLPRDNCSLYPLFTDEYAVICWDQNAACQQGLSRQTFLDLKHVVVKFGSQRNPAYSEVCLGNEGIERDISLGVGSFSDLPLSVVGTQLLATMHKRYAEHFAKILPISVHPMPIPMPAMTESVAIHKTREKDPAFEWLRTLFKSQLELLNKQA